MFLDLARKRFSVRSYEKRHVEREKLLQVIEAARISPSACNFQPRHFIIFNDEEAKKNLCTVYSGKWLQEAPAIIVVCGDHSKSWKRADGKDHCDIDTAIAIDHMTLAAADLGLGTCWICAFDAKKCHKLLDLPPELEVIALLPIGYPAVTADINRFDERRRSIDEILDWNTYNRKG